MAAGPVSRWVFRHRAEFEEVCGKFGFRIMEQIHEMARKSGDIIGQLLKPGEWLAGEDGAKVYGQRGVLAPRGPVDAPGTDRFMGWMDEPRKGTPRLLAL